MKALMRLRSTRPMPLLMMVMGMMMVMMGMMALWKRDASV